MWVTIWDHDAGYRSVAPEPGAHTMGGAPSGSTKVMDASPVLRLR